MIPVIPGYEICERVGQGGMATVYRAMDVQLSRTVALKVLTNSDLADDADFRERFVREAKAAAAIDDPHVIPIFAAGEADDLLYIAMRYVPGGDLRRVLKRDGRLAPVRAGAIIAAVASALDAGHRVGLIHRDVKPANILLDTAPGRQMHVYLSDFGLSKTWQSSARTQSGLYLGTADYSSPEQISGGQIDGRADQYALACTVFELLTGEPPYPHNEALAVMFAHVHSAPPVITERVPDLPAEVNEVFTRALAKSPDQRYGTCLEFADALGQVLGLPALDLASLTSEAPEARDNRPATVVVHLGDSWQTAETEYREREPPPAPPPPKKRHSRRLMVTAGASATVLVALIAGGYFALQPKLLPVASHQQHPQASFPSSSSAPASHAEPVVASSQPVLTSFKVCSTPVDTCTSGFMKTEPTSLYLSADGSSYVSNIAWSGWGDFTDRGQGILNLDDCIPNCATGTFATYQAYVDVSDPVPYGHRGYLAYAKLQVSAPDAPGSDGYQNYVSGIVPGWPAGLTPGPQPSTYFVDCRLAQCTSYPGAGPFGTTCSAGSANKQYCH